MRAVLFLLAVCFAVEANAQVATYQGRQYTPESYVRGATYKYPTCVMCNNIRAQWRAQGWVSGHGASKVMRQAQAASPVVEVAGEFRVETRSRTVTQYRDEPYQVRQCYRDAFGRQRCRLVTQTRKVPYQTVQTYQVRVPVVKATKPKPVKPAPVKAEQKQDSTPKPIVDAILSVMGISEDDTLYDVGSGPDARFLVRAVQRFGCRGVGIEIDPNRAQLSRKVIKAAGLEDRIVIITGDALQQDLSRARKVVVYQMEDLLADIVVRLRSGALIGSYMHPPFNGSREFRANGEPFYVGKVE